MNKIPIKLKKTLRGFDCFGIFSKVAFLNFSKILPADAKIRNQDVFLFSPAQIRQNPAKIIIKFPQICSKSPKLIPKTLKFFQLHCCPGLRSCLRVKPCPSGTVGALVWIAYWCWCCECLSCCSGCVGLGNRSRWGELGGPASDPGVSRGWTWRIFLNIIDIVNNE